MIVTSVPLGQIVQILRSEDYFDAYCFFLVREIQNKKLLHDLFEHHSSFQSVSGSHVLIVLFCKKAEDIAAVRGVKQDLYSRRRDEFGLMYAHHCKGVAIKLLLAMREYEQQQASDNGGTLEYGYDSLDRLGLRRDNTPQFELPHNGADQLLESVTLGTEEVKETFAVSEADLPCVLFADRGLSELSILHLREDDDIMVVYSAIRELVVRNCERRSNIRRIENQIKGAQTELKQLRPTKRSHIKRLEAGQSQLASLEISRDRLEQPESISSIISGLERRRALRKHASRVYKVFSSSETTLKILQLVRNFL